MPRSKSNLIFIFVFATSAALCVYFNRPSDRLIELKPQIIPPKQLVHFSLGFQMALADALWIRTLQADDFCESPNTKASFNPAWKIDEALKEKLTPSRCHKGWVYQMFDLATELNPNFKWVYKMGGVQLSIAVDDREGARLIFEKGVQRYPDDWQLLYRATYHYIFEIQDGKRATELLLMASKLPDPPPVIHLMASRLALVSGRSQMAIDILEDYLKQVKPDSEGYMRAKARLDEMYKERDSRKSIKN